MKKERRKEKEKNRVDSNWLYHGGALTKQSKLPHVYWSDGNTASCYT
jgi:hypothetical protein